MFNWLECQASDPKWQDEVIRLLVRQFGRSEENEGMTDPNPAGQRIHIIDRVPDLLRQQNENADRLYSPTTISIGPLHKWGLEAMKPVKLSYTRTLLARNCASEETTQFCVVAILKVKEAVLNCYQLPEFKYIRDDESSFDMVRFRRESERNRLYEMTEGMLIDCCFVIELVYRNYINQYDPILWNPFKFYAIQRDLLLVENQIPFFVLQELFNLTVGKIPNEIDQHQDHYSLPKLLLSFFGDMMGFENGGREELGNNITPPRHILHFFHIYYLPRATTNNPISDFTYEERTGIKYTATQLGLVGVKLKAALNRRNLFDIRFRKAFSWTSCLFLFQRGYLQIPPFSVSESTESFLLNLIAFEQMKEPEIDSYFTSHAFLMDILIETPEDVKLLEEAGIIRNYLGSKEEVVRLFNSIFKNAIPRRFHFSKQYKDAMDFHKSWRVSAGRIKQHYFGNPWSAISIYAAIILFTLTFLSTLYTMLSYYH